MDILLKNWTEEDKRIAINFEMAYDNWLERSLHPSLQNSMHIKEIGGHRYLYTSKNKLNKTEKSLGLFDTENENKYNSFLTERETNKKYEAEAFEHLSQIALQFNTIKIPKVNKTVGKILRKFDSSDLLGRYFLVVGSISFYAYGVAAGVKDNNFYKPTLDLDFTWYRQAYLKENNLLNMPQTLIEHDNYKTFISELRQIDPSFNLHHKKKYQAINSKAFEVEILCSPTSMPSLNRLEKNLEPYPIEEQEWLLKGTPIRQIVIDEDNLPVPINAPDPRWMALHKLWLSKKPSRDPRKVTKDWEQGLSLMRLIVSRLQPSYPLDESFASNLPPALTPIFNDWCIKNNFILTKKINSPSY